jgi:hypothetical protein
MIIFLQTFTAFGVGKLAAFHFVPPPLPMSQRRVLVFTVRAYV